MRTVSIMVESWVQYWERRDISSRVRDSEVLMPYWVMGQVGEGRWGEGREIAHFTLYAVHH